MYDVVIIGSGYSGSVMAARLAGRGRVLLVERGRRWNSGEFPATIRQLAAAYRTTRSPLGLWEMRLGAGTGNALVSGFGGASLVNYGITIQPADRAFETWPIRASALAPYFQRARETLQASANPLADQLADRAFLDRIEPGRRIDLENTIDWQKCTQCGNCMPGCNVDAKRSLDRTYLTLALQRGAEVVVGHEATACEALPTQTNSGQTSSGQAGWQIALQATDGRSVQVVQTRQIVLAAGTFGTLDFLWRNRATLPTTELFGQQMSMNGDSLSFLYNLRFPVSGHQGAPIGTCVQLPFLDGAGRERTLTVMSGRIPAFMLDATARLMACVVGVFTPGEHFSPEEADEPLAPRAARRWRDLRHAGPEGALSQTFMYKLDGQDGARGRAHFDAQGRSAIDWSDYADDPVFRFAAERLEGWARALGGTIVRNMGTWPLMRSFGVHPLGGCRMALTPEAGVVDARCRLYDPRGGVHAGIRIVDGSVIPEAIGVPPSLTIAANAERIAEDLLSELAAERL